MSMHFIQIDVSNSRFETDENFIKIKFRNKEVHQVNISKLFIQSKYLLEKYKYAEALNSFQTEIEKIEEKFNINDESIIFFLQLVQDEKVNIPIEHYKSLYTLSEYFCIQKFIVELDNINQKQLFRDLNFTIQILLDSEKVDNCSETKLMCKIENFLSERINECIENSKFKELRVSTISRILDKSQKSVNHNLLIDFIVESAGTRFILFKFIEFQKLENEKVEEFIEFIDEQEEDSKKLYLEYIPFNFSFIKHMKSKYNKLVNEINQENIKQEQIKKELIQSKQELEKELLQIKSKYDKLFNEMNQINEKFEQTKVEMNQMKEELNKTKIKYEQARGEINQTNNELEKTKNELNQIQIKYIEANEKIELNNNDNKQQMKIISIAGFNKYNQMGEKPNNNNKKGDPIIFPPMLSSLDPFSLSYSVYNCHLVLITGSGSLMCVGNNEDSRIIHSLQKSIIDHFTEFTIKDGRGYQIDPVSAVCCNWGTLFMFSKISKSGRKLVLCNKDINDGNPVFLDIGNRNPVALFGGGFYSAAICSEGEVIFINHNSVKNSPESRIEAVFLPDREKASSVACCKNTVVVLSSSGRVFESQVQSENILKFSEVVELKGKEIVCVSGTNNHFLAVSKEGRVFGCGSNDHGQLGLGKEILSVSEFTEISSLSGYEIKAAYAGGHHSIFETRAGKVLACGYNNNGQLLLSSGISINVYSPMETTITGGATFCIAGYTLTVVFIGCSPPPNTPNKRIFEFEA